MLDHEKLQRGRAWAYAVGAAAFVVVAVWRLVIH
jgi:hypothetical protein